MLNPTNGISEATVFEQLEFILGEADERPHGVRESHGQEGQEHG